MLRVGAKIGLLAVALLVLLSGAGITAAVAENDQICNVAADFALGREDYITAITLHHRLLQSQPDNALAHYHLGFAYGMSGRSSEELSEYQTSARLGLRSWDLFLNLGLVYLDQHELTQAAEALQTAAVLGPGHTETHFNLALVYQSENRLGDALREIAVARRLAPEDPDAANTNAILCVEAGDLITAHDIWSSLVLLAPDYAPAHDNLSILNRSHAFKEQHVRFAGNVKPGHLSN